jgi:hypothetical protein
MYLARCLAFLSALLIVASGSSARRRQSPLRNYLETCISSGTQAGPTGTPWYAPNLMPTLGRSQAREREGLVVPLAEGG